MLRTAPAGDAITAGHKYGNMVRWLREKQVGVKRWERSQAGGGRYRFPPSFGRSGRSDPREIASISRFGIGEC